MLQPQWNRPLFTSWTTFVLRKHKTHTFLSLRGKNKDSTLCIWGKNRKYGYSKSYYSLDVFADDRKKMIVFTPMAWIGLQQSFESDDETLEHTLGPSGRRPMTELRCSRRCYFSHYVHGFKCQDWEDHVLASLAGQNVENPHKLHSLLPLFWCLPIGTWERDENFGAKSPFLLHSLTFFDVLIIPRVLGP